MKEPYQVLARKYRPKDFSSILGQDLLVTIFKNIFAEDRLGQAFLLTGMRGTGKTTIARILASCFNCHTMKKELEPCNQCENCIKIQQDIHPDVMEVDAASRSKVEDMRDLMQGISYEPIMGKFKVFIIDEVHMLSKSAFNAMLKNLEEPPLYVKFILATTEVGKVPDTIISRCQSFHLKRINTETIIKGLKSIIEKEKKQLPDSVLKVVAEASEGSMRDALSILEQVLCLKNPTEEQVLKLLGKANRQKLTQLLSHCTQGNMEASLKTVEEVYENGLDGRTILCQMLEILNSISLEQHEKIPLNSEASNIIIQSIEESQFLQDSLVTMKICVSRLCHMAKSNKGEDSRLINLLRKLEAKGASIEIT